MARDADKRARVDPGRPWWTSPVLPSVLVLAGVALLLLDGLHPYRTYLRRRSWVPVQGSLVQSYERRRHIRLTSTGLSPTDYLARQPQQRIFPSTVSAGWPLKRKKIIWRIRLNYTYPWKTDRLTRIGDGPDREFESRRDAERFLATRLKGTSLKVYVNPAQPQEATAFLDYHVLTWFYLGLVTTVLALFWLVLALILGRSHRRQEDKARAAAEKKS